MGAEPGLVYHRIGNAKVRLRLCDSKKIHGHLPGRHHQWFFLVKLN
jgi:translation initiation factor IF-1